MTSDVFDLAPLAGAPPTLSSVRWTSIIGEGRGPQVQIGYGAPVHLDWSASEPQLPPLEALVLRFHPSTSTGRFEPAWRADSLLSREAATVASAQDESYQQTT